MKWEELKVCRGKRTELRLLMVTQLGSWILTISLK